MCQLLGLNSNLPTDICFSFKGFKARGGGTDIHGDGWGIAFFDGPGLHIVNEPQPSCRSRLAEMISHHPFPASNIVAHIRKATVGAVRLENTHPFSREQWGSNWVFAHNGTLLDFTPDFDGRFRPVGSTDSERAFCWLMQEMRRRFGDVRPPLEVLFGWLGEATVTLTRHGVINFLLSDGDVMLAHCSTRLHYVIRQAPFGEVHLQDADLGLDLTASLDPDMRAVLLATVPLTRNEDWVAMPAGSLWAFREGTVLATADTLAGRIPEGAQACS